MAATGGRGGRKVVPKRKRVPQRSHVPPKIRVAAKDARDQLPEQVTANARTMRYAVAMAEVRQLVKTRAVKRAAWMPIAEFQSARGAAEVRLAMLRGDRPVDGDVTDWEIEARRADGSDAACGSVLWVRLSSGG